MGALFIEAVNHFGGSPPAITKAEIEERHRQLLKLRESFRDNLDRLRVLGGYRNAEANLAAVIAELDRKAETFSGGIGTASTPVYRIKYSAAVIDRHRGDPKLRTFLEALAFETSCLFRSPLYGTVATIASVMFGENVTATMARSASRPVLRASKSSA